MLSRTTLDDSLQLFLTVYCNECAHLGVPIVFFEVYNSAFVVIIESQNLFCHLLFFL